MNAINEIGNNNGTIGKYQEFEVVMDNGMVSVAVALTEAEAVEIAREDLLWFGGVTSVTNTTPAVDVSGYGVETVADANSVLFG